MKIGILGAGTVARTLGAALATKGHEIYISTRRPASKELATWQQTVGSAVQIGSLQDAAAFGEIIILAINPWTEIEPALTPLVQALHGKVVIDVSNNIAFGAQPKLAFTDKSMGEYVQSIIPGSLVVKTLNITPAAMMVEPAKSGITPAIGWVSGNDSSAKQTVAGLLNDLGWTAVTDLGDIQQARLQESIGLTLTLIVTSVMAQ